MFSVNRQKRLILIFTGSVAALVGVSLVVAGISFIVQTGEIFGYLMVIFGLFTLWISTREFSQYHKLKREFEADGKKQKNDKNRS